MTFHSRLSNCFWNIGMMTVFRYIYDFKHLGCLGNIITSFFIIFCRRERGKMQKVVKHTLTLTLLVQKVSHNIGIRWYVIILFIFFVYLIFLFDFTCSLFLSKVIPQCCSFFRIRFFFTRKRWTMSLNHVMQRFLLKLGSELKDVCTRPILK